MNMRKSISWFLLSVLLVVFTASHSAVAQEKKTAYGLLVDNTLSLRKQLPQVIMLGKGVAARVHQRGPIALFNFKLKPDPQFFGIFDGNDADEGHNSERACGALGVEWTQDEHVLSKYLETLTVVRGNTDLFSAIQLIAEAVSAKASAENNSFENKIIILMTDGEHRMELIGGSPDDEDYERKKREQKLIRGLNEAGIRVFAVGLVQDLNSSSGRYRLTTRERAESFLKRITKQTGGRIVFPKSKQFDVDAVVKELLGE